MVLPSFRFACLLILVGASATLGCTRQEEGERCSQANNNEDCEGNLVCTSASDLRKGDDEVDRCCPEELSSSSSSLCAPRTNSAGGDGDETGDGGGGGEAGDGDGDTSTPDDPKGLGDACDYSSECTEPLICGPRGACQYECQTDRDCDDGETCNKERSCVAG